VTTQASLRIGLIAPPWVDVPPTGYGGTEVVVDNLARGLRRRGHEVVLFTVGTSTSPVERRWLFERPVSPMGLDTAEAAHVLAAYERLTDVDLIHDHTNIGALVAASTRPSTDIPVVTTNHGLFSPEIRRILAVSARGAAVVAISRAQARDARPVPVAAVIHHGIDLDVYRPGPGDGGYLLFIGRMSPEKGVDAAVRIARRAGRRLVVVAKMRDPDEREYYARHVRPLLGPDDEEPREEPLSRRLDLLRHATALLNPIGWAEPFGLVMAESLASGTPVVALPRGAAPEIVDDGVTGFLVDDEEAAARAVARVGELDRAACRQAAVQRFSLERMAADHEALYRRVLDARAAERDPHGRSLVEATATTR
jgi:glycosyltransferase involved in cell wall biosynthesis